MMTIKVKDKEYKVRFGYNSFCDTDLMDRTKDLLKIVHGSSVEDDEDAKAIGKIKDLFLCVRELLFVGFKKDNPVKTVQEIGDILDDYMDEETEEEKRGILDLFTKLAQELLNEGFLSDLLGDMKAKKTEENVTNIQQAKKKTQKK